MLSGLIDTAGPSMERTIAADLHACIEGLAKAAPATGEELTISTGNLNVTMVAVSAENVSSTIAEMRLNTTDDLAARVHVPTDLLSGTVGYDPTKPVAALLFTTSGTELYRPLSTATYARSSPPVSFSIVQDGVALPVQGLAERINISIPFVLTYDEDEEYLEVLCRWYQPSGTWSVEGCVTIFDQVENSVTCSCDHLTDFAVLERPYNDSYWEVWLEEERERLYIQQLVRECQSEPNTDTFGWLALAGMCGAGLIALLHAMLRDKCLGHRRKGEAYLYDKRIGIETPLGAQVWRGSRQRINKSCQRGGFLHDVLRRHPLIAGLCWSGLYGYTRCQTIQTVINTMAVEMFVAGLLVTWSSAGAL